MSIWSWYRVCEFIIIIIHQRIHGKSNTICILMYILYNLSYSDIYSDIYIYIYCKHLSLSIHTTLPLITAWWTIRQLIAHLQHKRSACIGLTRFFLIWCLPPPPFTSTRLRVQRPLKVTTMSWLWPLCARPLARSCPCGARLSNRVSSCMILISLSHSCRKGSPWQFQGHSCRRSIVHGYDV